MHAVPEPILTFILVAGTALPSAWELIRVMPFIRIGVIVALLAVGLVESATPTQCPPTAVHDTRHALGNNVATTHCPDVRSIHCVPGTNKFYAWNYETPPTMLASALTPAGDKLLHCTDAVYGDPRVQSNGPFHVMPLAFEGVLVPDASGTFYCVYARILQTYDPCVLVGPGEFDLTRCRAGTAPPAHTLEDRAYVWLMPVEPRTYDVAYMRDGHPRFIPCGAPNAPACIKHTREIWCVVPTPLQYKMCGTECYCSFPYLGALSTDALADPQTAPDPWTDSCGGSPRTAVGKLTEKIAPYAHQDVTSDAWPGTTFTCPPPGYLACANWDLEGRISAPHVVSMDGTFSAARVEWEPFWSADPGTCFLGDGLDLRFLKMSVRYRTEQCEADYTRTGRAALVHNALVYSHVNTSLSHATCTYVYGGASLLNGTQITLALNAPMFGGISGALSGPWASSRLVTAGELVTMPDHYEQGAACVPDQDGIYASKDHRVRAADTCACAIRGVTFHKVGYGLAPSRAAYAGCCGALVTDAGLIDADGPTGGVSGDERAEHCHAPPELANSTRAGFVGFGTYGVYPVGPPVPAGTELVRLSCPPPNLLECARGAWFASSGFLQEDVTGEFLCDDTDRSAAIVFDAAYLELSSDAPWAAASTLRCAYTIPVKRPTAAAAAWSVHLRLQRPQMFQPQSASLYPATAQWGKRFGHQWDCDLRGTSGVVRNPCACSTWWLKPARSTATWAAPFAWSQCCTQSAGGVDIVDQICLDSRRISLACPVSDRLQCDASGIVQVRTPDPENSGVQSDHWYSSNLLCSLDTDARPDVACQGRRTSSNVVVAACPLGANAFEFAGAYFSDTATACSYRLVAGGAVGDLTFLRLVAGMPSTRQPKLVPGPRFGAFGAGSRCSLLRAEAASSASPTEICGFFGTASQPFSVREAGNALAHSAVGEATHSAYNTMRCPTASAIAADDGRLRVYEQDRWGPWVPAEFDDAGQPYAHIDWAVHGWPVIGRIYPVSRAGAIRVVCEYVAKPLPSAPVGTAPQRVALEYAPALSVVVAPFNERRDTCVLHPNTSPHDVTTQCECYKAGGNCEDNSISGGTDYSFQTTGQAATAAPAEPAVCPPAGVILCDASRGFYIDLGGMRVYAAETTVVGSPSLPCWTPRALGGMVLLQTELELVPNFTRVARWRCVYRIVDETCTGAATADLAFDLDPLRHNAVADPKTLASCGCALIAPHTYDCIELAVGSCDAICATAIAATVPDHVRELLGPACCDDPVRCVENAVGTGRPPATPCTYTGGEVAIPLPPTMPPFSSQYIERALQCVPTSARRLITASLFQESGGQSGLVNVETTGYVRRHSIWAACPDPVHDFICRGTSFDGGSMRWVEGDPDITGRLGTRVISCPAAIGSGAPSRLAPGWVLFATDLLGNYDQSIPGNITCYYTNQPGVLAPRFFALAPWAVLGFTDAVATPGPSTNPEEQAYGAYAYTNAPDMSTSIIHVRCARTVFPGGPVTPARFDALPTCGCPFFIITPATPPPMQNGLLINAFGCAKGTWAYLFPAVCPTVDCLTFASGAYAVTGFECISTAASCTTPPTAGMFLAKSRLSMGGKLLCMYVTAIPDKTVVALESTADVRFAEYIPSNGAPVYRFKGVTNPATGQMDNNDCCYDAATGKSDLGYGVSTSAKAITPDQTLAVAITNIAAPWLMVNRGQGVNLAAGDPLCPTSGGLYNGSFYGNLDFGPPHMCMPVECMRVACTNGAASFQNSGFIGCGISPRDTNPTCPCYEDSVYDSMKFIGATAYRVFDANSYLTLQAVQCSYSLPTPFVPNVMHMYSLGPVALGFGFDAADKTYVRAAATDHAYATCTSTLSSECGFYYPWTFRNPFDASYPLGTTFPCDSGACPDSVCSFVVYEPPTPTPSPTPAPSPTPMPTPTPTPLPSPSPAPSPSPSPSPLPSPSPSPSPSPFPSPSPVPNPSPAPSPSPTPFPSPSPSPTPSPSPSPLFPVARAQEALELVESYMTLTTCPPASCLESFVAPVGHASGEFTLAVPGFPRCTLGTSACAAPAANYTGLTFASATVRDHPISEEDPECSYLQCAYLTLSGASLVLDTRHTAPGSRSPAYLPAFHRSASWRAEFDFDRCTAGATNLECECPVYRMHGVPATWDGLQCCCPVGYAGCNFVNGPSPKFSSLCETAATCLLAPPPPPPPPIPCPTPPAIRTRTATCPPSARIAYGNDGWYVRGDTTGAFACDPDRSSGCAVAGAVFDSSVVFRELEMALAGPNSSVAVYVGCTYTALFMSSATSTPTASVAAVTMRATIPADYTPNDNVMVAPADNPSIRICSLAPAAFQRDVCACSLVVHTQRPPASWDACCCAGVSYTPCVLAGDACPVAPFVPSAGARHSTAPLIPLALIFGLLVL